MNEVVAFQLGFSRGDEFVRVDCYCLYTFNFLSASAVIALALTIFCSLRSEKLLNVLYT